MDAGLRDRIQAALGDAYRLDRELGGGGMSRVFVAKFRERSVDMDFECLTACELANLAQAYDLGGKPDSAIAVYERYLATKDRSRLVTDPIALGPSLKRLGELYEAKGDLANAAKRYAEFVELWKNADAVLQPSVKEVQQRLARLRSEPVRQVTPAAGVRSRSQPL